MAGPVGGSAKPSVGGEAGGRDGALGGGMVLMGLALALNSLLGPLFQGPVEYPLSRTLLNQTVGLDAVSLLVAAPVSVGAGILAFRGHRAAPTLALAPSAYVVYMFAQYVVGPDYSSFPRILPFHLALFVLGEVNAVRAWVGAEPSFLARRSSRSRDRILAAALLLLATFVVLRYLPGLVGSWSGEPIPVESREDPAMFWTIFLLDLGVVLPAAVVTAAALWAGAPRWARKAGLGLLGWFALVGVAVGAMGVAMYLDGDPNAAPDTVALMGTTGLLTAALALWAYRPLFGEWGPR